MLVHFWTQASGGRTLRGCCGGAGGSASKVKALVIPPTELAEVDGEFACRPPPTFPV